MSKQPAIGDTLSNGYTVVMMTANRESGLVLAENGNEYATWRYNVEQGERSTWSGNYFATFDCAVLDYLKRQQAL